MSDRLIHFALSALASIVGAIIYDSAIRQKLKKEDQ